MTVSPSTSSTITDAFSPIESPPRARAILSTSSSPSRHRIWPTPPAGIATTTRAIWPTRSLERDVGARLLAEQEPRKHVDGAAEDDPAHEPDARGRDGRQAVVGRDRAKAAERRDEHGHDPTAEDAGAAMIEVRVQTAAEVVEHLAEHQRDDQEQESNGGDREEDRERRNRREQAHAMDTDGKCAHSREGTASKSNAGRALAHVRRVAAAGTGSLAGARSERALYHASRKRTGRCITPLRTRPRKPSRHRRRHR